MNDRLIAGEGTPEPTWQDWLTRHPLTHVNVATLLRDSASVHIVAPHPDDEILACGGLIGQLSSMNVAVEVLAVTDGEASHPDSARWPTAALTNARAQESEAALSEVSVHARRKRLKLPDGAITEYEHRLFDMLTACFGQDDLVIAPWRLDGHPDHEATARASLAASVACGCRFMEVPIWGWHWADPADDSFPWQRALALPLADRQHKAKIRAIQKFRTQLEPDSAMGRPAVLPAFALNRLQRTFEVFFL